MKQNDVGFDAQGLQIADALLVVREELRVEAIEVELSVVRLHIRKARRSDVVEGHPLGENQKSHFVERIPRERGERADLEIAITIQPVV